MTQAPRIRLLTLFFVVMLLGLAWLSQPIMAQDYQRLNLELPERQINNTQSQQQTENFSPELREVRYTLQRNQGLGHALQIVADNGNLLWRIGRHENAHYFTRLRSGDEIIMWLTADDELARMELNRSPTLTYILEMNEELDKGMTIYAEHKEVKTRIVMASGEINDSFYLGVQAVGASPRTIMNLADIYSWEVDFVRELREGDEFTIVYERRYIDGQYIGDGAILAAQLHLKHRNRTINAFRFEHEGELLGYFNENGDNLRKAFMRNPINYTRISSRFQRGRYHPVLQEIRDHKGVDYAAPTGTPIYAAGDGTVKFRGWGRGYGNYIILQHAGRYETVYGHMSRFGKFKQGQRVKQGDVIGYVGMTGLATGPHLHYEFRINGVHHDPLTVEFPGGDPVAKELQPVFAQWAGLLNAQLRRTDPSITQLAKLFE
ncbi:peptidase M23 [Thiomicrospira aerophila AL3]|uniref:Peptidase M23 n=1 Tax=Thiomicrospira aerophila AL3 TaxID=717772 RepID=W0DUB2_9GAMM|nr:M23 family metallopeptidase [Thiomicrospira aerophila]AHF00863.1 peptidase M23 [Thiomicrospira aerophila AL3]